MIHILHGIADIESSLDIKIKKQKRNLRDRTEPFQQSRTLENNKRGVQECRSATKLYIYHECC